MLHGEIGYANNFKVLFFMQYMTRELIDTNLKTISVSVKLKMYYLFFLLLSLK